MQHINQTPELAQPIPIRHQAFISLLTITFFSWTLYRILFAFPVWFDEVIGKAVFFGLPVWLYSVIAQSKVSLNSLMPTKLKQGLYIGLAVSGLYGSVGTIAVLLGYSSVQEALLFFSADFWWQVFLAICTGFWESLFFFGWVLAIAEKRFTNWSELKMLFFTSIVFLLFHIPNILLRTGTQLFYPQLFLLFAFSFGQGLLFLRYRNLYALTLSQAAWGLILLFYSIR